MDEWTLIDKLNAHTYVEYSIVIYQIFKLIDQA